MAAGVPPAVESGSLPPGSAPNLKAVWQGQRANRPRASRVDKAARPFPPSNYMLMTKRRQSPKQTAGTALLGFGAGAALNCLAALPKTATNVSRLKRPVAIAMWGFLLAAAALPNRRIRELGHHQIVGRALRRAGRQAGQPFQPHVELHPSPVCPPLERLCLAQAPDGDNPQRFGVLGSSSSTNEAKPSADSGKDSQPKAIIRPCAFPYDRESRSVGSRYR